MEINTKEELEIIKSFTPNIKLSGLRLPEVLNAIKRGERKREKVKTEVMKLFPNKSSKSVFRGMVIPTTTRLNLVRSSGDKATVFLSPNGRMVVTADAKKSALGKSIRDFSVLEVDLAKETVEVFDDKKEKIKQKNHSDYEKFRRFIKDYLDYFEIDLPQRSELKDSAITFLYPETNKYLTNKQKRRSLISKLIPKNQQVQIEKIRWKIIKSQLQKNQIITTWFVDKILKEEFKESRSFINFYKASLPGPTKLEINGEYFEAIVKRV